jgi:hypothetical protein
MKWTQEEHNYLVQLKEKGLMWHQIAEEMTMKFGRRYSKEQCRSRWRQNRHLVKNEIDPKDKYGKKINKNPDGTWEIDQLIEISKEQLKDDTYILEAHGYDSSKWEITSHQFSMWEHHNKVDGTIRLHASKIKIAPKSNELNWDEFIQAIENRPTRELIPFKGKAPEKPTYLEIPLFDMHFGIADLDYYQDTLQSILELLQKSYKEVLITVGQDLIHNDNFKGETSNGTIIDKVNMVQAIDDAVLFYETIISEACKNSEHVTVVYSIGNHDKTVSYGITRELRKTFKNQPNATFDIEMKERKAFLLGTNFLGLTHGDKNRKNVAANFSVEFPGLWSKATTREVHMGHLHRKRTTKQPLEFTIDDKGVIVRELGAGNMIDQYHDEHGFNLAHKEFEIFEYEESKKKRIHYV